MRVNSNLENAEQIEHHWAVTGLLLPQPRETSSTSGKTVPFDTKGNLDQFDTRQPSST
jgi:hypothetical protein